MNGGKSQALLRLDCHRPDDLHIRGALDRIVEQCRFADSGQPPQDQGAAHPGTHAAQHPVDRALLSAAVDQPHVTTVTHDLWFGQDYAYGGFEDR